MCCDSVSTHTPSVGWNTHTKKMKRLRRSSSRLWCDGTADAFGHILTGWNPCWPYSTECLCSTDGGVSLYIYSCLLRWNGTRGASTAQELRILLSLLLLFISDGFFFSFYETELDLLKSSCCCWLAAASARWVLFSLFGLWCLWRNRLCTMIPRFSSFPFDGNNLLAKKKERIKREHNRRTKGKKNSYTLYKDTYKRNNNKN
jgi:hypothetical protein